LRQRYIDFAILRLALELCLCLIETFLCLTVIRKLPRQHELQGLVVWHLLDSLLRDFSCLTPLLSFPVGIHELLITTFSIVVTDLDHLGKGINRRLSLAHLAVNGPEPFEEYSAVVALGRRIISRRLAALLDQSLEKLDRFLVLALRLKDQRFVVR